MRMAALLAAFVALAMVLCTLPAVDGERDSLYILINFDEEFYEEGDTIQVTVYVFDKGVPANADEVNISFYTDWHHDLGYLNPASSSTGVYTASYVVADGDDYFAGDVEVTKGTDHEAAEFWRWIGGPELAVNVVFDCQESIAVAPGEAITATIYVRYNGNLVDADGFNELFIRDPEGTETQLTQQRVSTGKYEVTYTMPTANEDGDYELHAQVEYANAHGEDTGDIYLYIYTVWYSQISVAGNTLSFMIGVADAEGKAVAGATVALEDPDEMTGTTDGNGTVIFNIPGVWNGLGINGEVRSGGRNQSFETRVRLDVDQEPHHNYFDVIYSGDDDARIYRTNSQISRKYRAFNDTVPLQSQTVYYYVHFIEGDMYMMGGFGDMSYNDLSRNSVIVAHGSATTNSLGEFTVTYTSPSSGGALAYVFESGMPKQPQNYHPNHHPDYDQDDDLVYEQGSGWYPGITDTIGVMNRNHLADADIKIKAEELKVGKPTKVTVDFGKAMDDTTMLFAAWLPGEYTDISDAFEPGHVSAWEGAISVDSNIRLTATDEAGVYEGEAVIPEFADDQDEFTIAAGYMDEDGTIHLNSVVLAEGEGTGDEGFLGLGSMGLPLLLLVIIVLLLLVMMMRKKPAASQMPPSGADGPAPAFPEGTGGEPEPEFPGEPAPAGPDDLKEDSL